eukprot:scaffold516_cov307-Pavlova_lutheri.AAC.9
MAFDPSFRFEGASTDVRVVPPFSSGVAGVGVSSRFLSVSFFVRDACTSVVGSDGRTACSVPDGAWEASFSTCSWWCATSCRARSP